MPQWPIAASGAVMAILGSIHLIYVYLTPKLEPRDASIRASMEEARLVISRDTTIWRAWVGFNASHSTGAMFFGGMLMYWTLSQPVVFFSSYFLIGAGAAMLLAYLAFAALYWFKIPFVGILAATLLYAAGLIAHWMS